jgi:hypothetical protein
MNDRAGRGEPVISRIHRIEDKDRVILDLLLEVIRLRRLLDKHGIEHIEG